MINQSHSFYLKFFKNKGINVMLWNYRGYGLSEGQPTPDVMKSDADAIYDYVKNVIAIKGKIGVYGRSLGGIAASHLSNRTNMAIVDRTFANL
mmetsp:Transcript_7314/g.5297  ORF Transcript_7314/g.5297 Transcript_7314/m.5297 type:complete len:93 (-) Transcript_7314:1676-1954(-)